MCHAESLSPAVDHSGIKQVAHTSLAAMASSPVQRPPRIYKINDISHATNLTFFLQWTSRHSEPQVLGILQHIYIIEHAPVANSVAKVYDHDIPVHKCTVEQCTRCVRELGGYKFPFVGPWTPRGIIPHIGEHPRDFAMRIQESILQLPTKWEESAIGEDIFAGLDASTDDCEIIDFTAIDHDI